MIVFVEGISLIRSQGSQTQNIPPITSVNDNNVKSVAGIFFDPIEYKTKPEQTRVPWVANNASFLLVDIKLRSLIVINIDENMQQNKPAIATVVNFGVFFLHLKVTEKIEKPIEEVIPNTKPIKEDFSVFPKAIITIPIVANTIAIQTFKLILSLKNKKPSNVVKRA